MAREGGFFREFLARPREVGALAPSSPALGREIAACVPWSADSAVVEAGPGNGALTEFIAAEKPDGQTFFAVELNPLLASELSRRMPDLDVVVGDLCDLPAICAERGVSRVGAVIATLPWSLLPDDRQRALLDGIAGVLDPGGSLVFYIYVHALPVWRRSLFVKLLEERFESVEGGPIIWRNFPPAVVFVCRTPPTPLAADAG